ncbi:MAG: hypothetical protein D3903_11545 [Candidatus Electrothrix sp. GM3_4]|nr:hypothetical protein [Candidatus Electrothrix sp. GM3_4]
MNLTEQQKEKVKSLCLSYNVKTLSVFGSVLRADFNRDSDIDFIVDIDDADPLSYADKYFELKFSLEKLFGRAVDLLEEQSVKNPVLRQRIDKTKALIYG